MSRHFYCSFLLKIKTEHNESSELVRLYFFYLLRLNTLIRKLNFL